MKRTMRHTLAALSIGTSLLLAVSACDIGAPAATPIAATQVVNPTNTSQEVTATTQPTTEVTTQPTTAPTTASTVQATVTTQSVVTPSMRVMVKFADYKLQTTSVNPSLKPYKVEPGMANVSNKDAFILTAASKSLIEQNSFAVQFPQKDGDETPVFNQFYKLYESGRYSDKPVFVTTDSVLHVYHLMFDKVLRTTESQFLIADLKKLGIIVQRATQAQYDALKGTSAENAARRNLAYMTVANRLVDPGFAIPPEVQTQVTAELALIEAHAGRAPSVVMSIGGNDDTGKPRQYIEDYGQYVPRGHYTRSEDLKKYFKAMMWYGRITFRLRDTDETRSAILLSQALNTAKGSAGTPASQPWANIYEPTSFFVGGADDLTYRDYVPLIDQAFGPGADVKAIADDAKVAQFRDLAKSLAGPRINSMFVYIWEDKDEATKGLRMMGQRFTLDEYLFGQLIWRNVGETDHERWLPKGLDVPAALGSQEAYSILDQMGETRYKNYSSQMEKVRGEVKNLPASQWTENLYWSWLDTFRPLIQSKAPDSGYPSFMTSSAWTRKDLNTVLGSWTELKHDTLLYAKQVAAEMGGGPEDLPKGYVEPEPEFYARIAALAGMTRDGLKSRGLLQVPQDPTARSDYKALNDLEKLALDLKRISEKELEGKTLTKEEYELIQYYGGAIEQLTIAASDASDPNVEFPGDLGDQDSAVVADVATGQSTALEEGTGRIMEIYVVAPIEGKLVLTRGGVYSQYEFEQPLGDRLTDEQWRDRLNKGDNIPPLGDWKTFIGK